MRVVFMGSPAFALPSLRRLADAGHEIVGVFTQPDRPSGRGRRLTPPPVKELALERGLPVFQPRSISSGECVEQLRALTPDVGVIAAYGQILKQAVLDVPRLGVLNVHASLLPRWRGAAPVVAAILHGDAEAGASIMKVVRELDAGPVLAEHAIPIAPDDTAGRLTHRIAEIGADLLVDVLPAYERGDLRPRPQDESLATYAPQVKKSDALIDWERDDADAIARQVRAYNPWPMAYTYLDGAPFRIVEAVALQHNFDGAPGTIFTMSSIGETPLFGAGFCVRAAERDLGIVRVQPAGKPVMLAAEYLRGHGDIIGKRFTSTAPAPAG
jgi:methionyl-tRNA formyltransferase